MANNLKGTFTNGRSILGQMRAEARRERIGPVAKRSVEERAAMIKAIHAEQAAKGIKPWTPKARR